MWTKLDEEPGASGVVRQDHLYGCGAACAEMLLADRGIHLEQLNIVTQTGLRLPCTAQELQACLNTLSAPAHRWNGGSLDLRPPVTPDLLAVLGEHGSWAAQLIPPGQRDGHWVVIDGMKADQTIVVRDPIGSKYRMPIDEFVVFFSLWSRCSRQEPANEDSTRVHPLG